MIGVCVYFEDRTEFAERLCVWCERRERVKEESRSFGLSIWEDRVVIY